MFSFTRTRFAALALGLLSTLAVQAADVPASQLAAIKQKLGQRFPDLPPVTEAQTTPIEGLIEVRAGGHIFYTDPAADYIIEGHMTETRTGRDLTEARLEEINRIDFKALPFKDAVVWKNGNGKRKMVIFSDANCGYCKRLERDLQQVKDVTVYTFMVAILGEDSRVKLDNIWCGQDRTQAYRDWMINGVQPPKAFGACASPAQRNGALAQRFNVRGTPAIFFEDGSRIGGAAAAAVIEQRLAKASGSAK